MRAHMALKYAAIKVELRQVELKNMPIELINISPKSTVPVLQLDDKKIIDESWDIVKWALLQNDPDNWLGINNQYLPEVEKLVEKNDYSFKKNLDFYKYANRFPEHSEEYYRNACEIFIGQLELMLSDKDFLLSKNMTLADIAVFPFVRQFSMVNIKHFRQSSYIRVQRWLERLINTPIFQEAFTKHPTWKTGNVEVYL
ncbi:MAG: glutathione S-transferase [Gammaproteobacteria bacterium]|nr:glutathione S-transferase [Gammaproteobacteria bacterium]